MTGKAAGQRARDRTRKRLRAVGLLLAVVLLVSWALWLLWPAPEPEPAPAPPAPEPKTVDIPPVSPPPPKPKPRISALADLQPLSGTRATGTVALAPLEGGGGVRASYQLRGLMPGSYALRIHAVGDCSAADGSSAGPLVGSDPAAAELARMEVNATRFAKGSRDVAGFELGSGSGDTEEGDAGSADILGRSVIAETLGGIRVACGVIRPR